MTLILKLGKKGINAFNDTNPDNFSIYIDQKENYPLTKERARNIVDVGASTTKAVNHALGYIPLCFVFKLETGGIWKKLFGSPIDNTNAYFTVDKQNLTVINQTASAKTFKYFIFYDNIQS